MVKAIRVTGQNRRKRISLPQKIQRLGWQHATTSETSEHQAGHDNRDQIGRRRSVEEIQEELLAKYPEEMRASWLLSEKHRVKSKK